MGKRTIFLDNFNSNESQTGSLVGTVTGQLKTRGKNAAASGVKQTAIVRHSAKSIVVHLAGTDVRACLNSS